MEDAHLKWKVISRREQLHTRIFSVFEEESEGPKGSLGRFVVLDAPDWAMIVPEIEGPEGPSFVMVRQWRHGGACLSVEFPGGVIEPGEDPMKGVIRELREETGYCADSVEYLGSAIPNPAFQRNRCHVFRARGLRRSMEQQLDSDEFLDVEIVPQSRVADGFGKEPFEHSLVIVALRFWERR